MACKSSPAEIAEMAEIFLRYPRFLRDERVEGQKVPVPLRLLKKASLAMMRDILRSDAKQPKLLLNELFGV